MSGNPDSTPTGSPRTTRRSARRCARWPRTRSRPTRPRSTRRPATRRRRTTPSSRATSSRRTCPRSTAGSGADALATCIVIEEVARVCASSSLIPAVNKLGSMPLILAGERRREAALPHPARGRRDDVLVRPVRARGRLRHRGDDAPGGARRRRLGAHRPEVVDHQCRCVAVLHGARRHRPRRPARQQHHRVRRRGGRPGVHLRREGAQARHQGQPDPRADLRPHPHPR